MSVRLLGALIACSFLTLSGPADAQRRPKATPTSVASPISQTARMDATKEVLACTNAAPLPRTCERTWRGLKWLLVTKTWTAQIDLPSGVRWFAHCRYDAIDREDRCVWSTGDEFSIVRGEGYSTLVNWGNRRFPSSNMEARFDNEPSFSTTAETWSNAQSKNIYSKMISGNLLRYRWFSWPERSERGGSLDLASFPDAAALMEALRGEFYVRRLLKQIPADQ